MQRSAAADCADEPAVRIADKANSKELVMAGLEWRLRSGGGRSAVIAAAFAFLSATATLADEATVTIDNFTFTPATLTIKPGTKVTFVNHDDIPHLIVDAGGKFRSKVLDTDESYSMTFDTAGDVSYFCSLHPHMKGRIVIAP
jgi:plastocyanin